MRLQYRQENVWKVKKSRTKSKWYHQNTNFYPHILGKFESQKTIPTFLNKARNIELYVRVHGLRVWIKSWFRRSFPKSKTHSDIFWNLAGWKPESLWRKYYQPLAEVKLCGIWLACPNVTYIFMFSRTVPGPELSYCGYPVAYAGNV